MDPGDQVILLYEEYNQLKQAAKENNDLKKVIQDLTHQLQVIKQKTILKNTLLYKEQFKVQYLISLFDDINKDFGIKAEDIGKGLKFLKNMDETYYSVIKLPSEIDDSEQLPDNFSKSTVYMEVDAQLEAYKNLAEVCTKQWNEKLKLIQYLEVSMKTLSSKDIKKIEEEAEKKEKLLKAQVEGLKSEKMQLRFENVELQSTKESLQGLNEDLKKKLQEMIELGQKEQKKFINNMQDFQMKLDHANLKSSQNENELNEKILMFENREKQLLKRIMNLEERKHQHVEMLKKMEQEQNQVKDLVDMQETEKIKLKAQVQSQYKEIEQLRRFAQISSEKVETLKNQVQAQQIEILSLRKSTSSNDHVTDIKSKLFSLISEYIIYLNKSLIEMNLTAAEKKTIIKSEALEVEEQFEKELKKLQF